MYMLRSLSHDTEKCDMYLPRSSATDQANAVWELTQHVRETTSEVSEQYDHSDKNCRVVLSCGTVYRAVLGGSNICRWENC